jgi:GTPase
VDDPVEFNIHSTYLITGAGIVVYGLLKSGTVHIGQKLLLGPDKQKKFIQVSVRHIHVDRSSVKETKAG